MSRPGAVTGGGGGGGGGEGAGGGGDGGAGDSGRRVLAFSEVIQHTLQELAHLQDCMLQMNVKMDKMKDVVGLVALGFQVHKLGVIKIDKRLQAVEWRLDASGEGENEEEEKEEYAVGKTTIECEEQMLNVSSEAPAGGLSARGGRKASSPSAATATAVPRRDASLPARSPPAPTAPAAPAAAAARPRPRSDQRPPPPPPPTQPPRPPSPPPTRGPRVATKRRTLLGRQLLQAVEAGSAEKVAQLLDAGADANFSTAGRWVPLHRAARKGDAELVSLLLRRGADVHARTSYGFTALHVAAHNDLVGSCAALLVAAGCDVDGRTKSGRTALHAAAETGNAAAARVLVAAGAAARARDDAGRTPADVARTQELQLLLERAASAQQKMPPMSLLRERRAQAFANDVRARE